MGFSVTACVIAGVMFICYCFALAEFGYRLRCRNSYIYQYPYMYDGYCYSSSTRYQASVGAGLGSCQLIFAIVEFFVALASSIYCCNAVCCGAPALASVSNEAFINVGEFILETSYPSRRIIRQTDNIHLLSINSKMNFDE